MGVGSKRRAVVFAAVGLAALGLAACAAPASYDTAEEGASTDEAFTLVGKACAKSRSQILASVAGRRRAAIERGFGWLDANVQYSQTATYRGYRTDCSGFVSMSWGVEQPGLTTRDFPVRAREFTFLRSYDQLQPGDAVDDSGDHVVLFLGWNDDAHADACVIEMASSSSDMQFRTRSVAKLKREGYKPFRPVSFGS